MKMLITLILIFLLSISYATNYQVGPDKPYKSLQEVAALLNPGDTVLVDGDHTYPGGVEFERTGAADNPIVIKGVEINGNRPVLSGGTNTIQFSTYPYDQPGADYYVLDGFEITGGTKRGIFHQASDLIVRNTVVYDCPEHGILGADQGSGNLTLEFVEVYGCGSGTLRHQLYIATDQENRPGSVFRMRFCYIHDGNGGNNLKSRAERNEIYYNWFENAYYHELELIGPEYGDPTWKREDSDVVGNIIWDKNNYYLVRVGGDGTGETNGRYRFLNNTFICNSRAAIRLFDGVESVELHNNVFYRPGASAPVIISNSDVNWSTGNEVMNGFNNWVETGSSSIPSGWSGTLEYNDPGFSNFTSDNLYPDPVKESTLINAGSESYHSPDGFDFPNPLAKPLYEPPTTKNGKDLKAVPRPTSGIIDIGALENRGADAIKKLYNLNTPNLFKIKGNYPNPFNPSTTIEIENNQIDNINPFIVKIFSSNGSLVRQFQRSQLAPGIHYIVWNGKDRSGHDVPSGVYICEALQGRKHSQIKMTLIR